MRLALKIVAAAVGFAAQTYGQFDHAQQFFLRDSLYGQYASAPTTPGEPLAFVEPTIDVGTALFHVTDKFLKLSNDDSAVAIDTGSTELNPFSFRASLLSDLANIAYCAIINSTLRCTAAGKNDFYICNNPANHLYIGAGEDAASHFERLGCMPTVLQIVDA